MKLKIAFFTESNFIGKVVNLPDNNLRTDLAWQYLLNADHFSLQSVPYELTDTYDIGIIIPPKNKIGIIESAISIIQAKVNKLAVMQEGPHDYWTDYHVSDQISYLNVLNQADFLLCHNSFDKPYYIGLTGKPVYVMPSVMVESSIPKTVSAPNKKAIVGGNMCKWYNGMVSLLVAKEYSGDEDVWIPSMGRKMVHEDRVFGVKHLPYMKWRDWMQTLPEFEIAVHLMPTIAAGTFSLNCAYWRIPCIGYNNLDTQNILFPNLSVNLSDVRSASILAKRLREDRDFYTHCSKTAQAMYYDHYSSDKFLENMKNIFKQVFNLSKTDSIEF